MRKPAALVLVAAASWVAAFSIPQQVRAETAALHLAGNSFSIREAQAIGQQLEIVGLLDQLQSRSPFSLPGITDWSTEYTLHIYDLTLADPPGQMVKTYNGGVIELWAGPVDAPFGPGTAIANIPRYDPLYDRPAVPITFANGTLLLQGHFSSFSTIRFAGDIGSISSSIEWVAGSKLADLVAQGIENDWHWNGDFNAGAAVPPGYGESYGGSVERAQAVSVEPTTWGRVKELWRGE